jgi:N4-gp56 family major capsid protein
MAVNLSPQYQAALRRQLAKEVLPIAQRYLVAHQHAIKRRMEQRAGVTWTATRFNRLPLPFQPLSEGVPPIGEQLSISQVTGVALQWGDKVTLSDVAVIVTMYDLVKEARKLLAVQIAETHERNAMFCLMGSTQVNYVGQVGARAALVAGSVLDTVTLNRTYSDLQTLGAPFIGGQLEPDITREIEHGARASERGPMNSDHYVAIVHPLVANDLRQNAAVQQAWSFSDVTRLYINEFGYWSGIHFTWSNMVPQFSGQAAPTGTPVVGGGTFPAGTYTIQITGTDTLNLRGEQYVSQVSAGVAIAANGSATVTMPANTAFTYTVYVSAAGATTPSYIATTSTTGVGAPTSGPLTGQATQLLPGSTVTLTGFGATQIPPAAPATGVTVFPTFVMGEQYYACLELDDVTYTFLGEADKSDPLNQLRVIGWKYFEGWCILNQQFGCRIESSASNTGAFG